MPWEPTIKSRRTRSHARRSLGPFFERDSGRKGAQELETNELSTFSRITENSEIAI
jgi:hypothetical protein